jgi:hypothetical protein
MRTRACSLCLCSSCPSLCLALCALLAASPALADQDPLGLTEDMKQPGAMTPADIRKRADPSADRSVVLSSSETLYQGDVTINSYDLIGLGVSYGITDSIELSGMTIIPAFEAVPFTFFLSGKFQIVRLSWLLVSIQTSAGVLMFLNDNDEIATLGASVTYDIIFDDQGDFVYSAGFQTNFNYLEKLSNSFQILLYQAFHARVAKSVKLLVEVTGGGFRGTGFKPLEEGIFFNYGVRLFSDTIAVDISFLYPSDPKIDLEYLPMGIPYVTFSARF